MRYVQGNLMWIAINLVILTSKSIAVGAQELIKVTSGKVLLSKLGVLVCLVCILFEVKTSRILLIIILFCLLRLFTASPMDDKVNSLNVGNEGDTCDLDVYGNYSITDSCHKALECIFNTNYDYPTGICSQRSKFVYT